MVAMRNKLAIIEAKLSESLNNERRNEENDAIEKIKENSKFFYKFAKKYSTINENIGPLQDKKGNIINGNKNMANLLSEQYRSVFSVPREQYEKYDHIDYKCEDMNDFVFTEENIRKNIMKLKNSKSPGPDGIIAECYKYGSNFIIDALIDIFCQMKDEGYSPCMSREAWISPTWKGKISYYPKITGPLH